ncbi:tRNA-(ms[2]io[6]A)-hydroxylase [Porifericola rhodea]|uniref:tRNA-(ms[2]io[6]A)-hydroxylase n=1 Tax=Porifericola rhodea TaxID=930972 RepID=UPI002666756C|nr:tRNA-(ms[2]io[6]A)-hydroxylase [Porifericola rhodea]WKN33555.1 tRNA-(ms[2]io[6]A)-hydroxylase [Porifericola rhodea]
MQYKIELTENSSQEWLDTVMSDFDSFLQDHADCERKASAMAMSFVAKYPERHEIIPELIATGIEELEHFQQVYEFMQERSVSLAKEMAPDPYIKDLMALSHGGTPLTRFRDRLLLASIIESRGCERFKMVSEAQGEESIKRFYKLLWASEAKHSHIFVHMALRYFDKAEVDQRIEELVNAEAEIVRNLPLRAALH